MKQETKELIENLRRALIEDINDNDGYSWLNCKGSEYLHQTSNWDDRIIAGEYKDNICQDPESNFNKLFALFDKFEETERDLAFGGLVKDSKGNWCRHGDKVRYTNRAGDVKTGTLDFDVKANLCWYLNDDESGDWLYLGPEYLEVCGFEKIQEEK